MNPTASLSTGVPSATAERLVRTADGWREALRIQLGRGMRLLRTPRRWSTRGRAFAVLAVLYVALSIMVLIPGTPVLHLDSTLVNLHMWHKHPGWHPWVEAVVGFGQRWIMTLVLQILILWAALRARSIRPIVQLATAIILLNVSVGTVKYALGRIGPIHSNDVHQVFVLGGNIFPSGHVSNTVVLYGIFAWALPKYRRALTALTVLLAVSVGLGTVYLRTHWFSDVVGGWIAGGMVLLAIPTVLPWSLRFADMLVDMMRESLDKRPRLGRLAHGIMRLARWIVPADPKFWGRSGAPESLRAADGPLTAGVTAPNTAAAVSEFDDWPTADRPGPAAAEHAGANG